MRFGDRSSPCSGLRRYALPRPSGYAPTSGSGGIDVLVDRCGRPRPRRCRSRERHRGGATAAAAPSEARSLGLHGASGRSERDADDLRVALARGGRGDALTARRRSRQRSALPLRPRGLREVRPSMRSGEHELLFLHPSGSLPVSLSPCENGCLPEKGLTQPRKPAARSTAPKESLSLSPCLPVKISILDASAGPMVRSGAIEGRWQARSISRAR